MKILMCTHDWSYTGGPLVLSQLAEALAEEHEVTLFGYGNGPLFNDAAKSKCKAYLRADCCIKAIDHTQPDLIIANTLLSYHSILEGAKRNIPTIWWLHEGEIAKKVLWRDEMEGAFNLADKIVVSSQYLQNLYTRYKYVPSLIKYGIPYTNIREEDCIVAVPESQGGVKESPKPLVYLVAGTVEPRKGQDIALAAYRELLKQTSVPTQLWIVGAICESPYTRQIVEMASSMESVKVASAMPPGVFAGLLDQADVLLCPSRDEGGYPQVLLQAQERGKLVISSDCCGMREQLKEHSGWIYGSYSKRFPTLLEPMIVATERPEEVKAEGARAREWAHKNNSMIEHVESWKLLIREVTHAGV